MKRSILSLCLIMILTWTYGQNIIEKHFSTYKNQDNFTSVHIASKAFELSAYLEFEDADEELQEFKDFLATVNAFDLIAGEEVESAAKKYQAGLKKVKTSHEELLHVEDKEGTFTFLIDEKGGIVNELVLLGTKEDKLVIFSLTGNMELSKISKMAKMMNEVSGGQFQKMLDAGMDEVKIYPNPLTKGDELNIDIPKDIKQANINIYNLNGSLLKSLDIKDGNRRISTADLPSGNYLLEIKSDKISIKRKILIR